MTSAHTHTEGQTVSVVLHRGHLAAHQRMTQRVIRLRQRGRNVQIRRTTVIARIPELNRRILTAECKQVIDGVAFDRVDTGQRRLERREVRAQMQIDAIDNGSATANEKVARRCMVGHRAANFRQTSSMIRTELGVEF
jgi:hypothetical protein